MIDDAVRHRLEAEIRLQDRDMKEVSLTAGLGETYVRDVIKRGRGKLENLFRVADVLGKPRDWLTSSSLTAHMDRHEAVALTSIEGLPKLAGRTRLEDHGKADYGSPIKVLGAAIGGSDGKLVFNGETLETVPRPAVLENVEGGYAAYVVGDSMVPRFKPGEKVWVHPHRPPRAGDDVVVQLYPEQDGDPPEGYIKQFVKTTSQKLVIFQHNPAEEIVLDRKLVKSVHVIVGSLFV